MNHDSDKTVLEQVRGEVVESLNAYSSSMERMEYIPKLGLWPLLLPVLILIPAINAFPYPSPGAVFSDITISHFPIALYLKHAIVEWRTIPLWSPAIYSGYPLFADPLSGLWYPPGWLALLLPLPFGFNLGIILHLLWGGLGMYRFLREEKLGHIPALFGALAFQSMPKLFAHYGAGHLTFLYAVSWTPWLLFAHKNSRIGLKIWRIKFSVTPGMIMALIFLADVRWSIFAGILWWGYAIVHNRYLLRNIYQLISQTFLAALLSAPLAIPLMEYTRLSTRANLSYEELMEFSLPPERLLGLIYPDFGGFHEWTLYSGGIVLILVVCCVFLYHGLTTWFWLTVGSLSLLISLGEHIPFFAYVYELPGLSLVRIPPRSIFLTGLAFAALSAGGFNELMTNKFRGQRARFLLGVVSLTFFAILLTFGIWVITGEAPLNFAWGAGVLAAGTTWLLLHQWIGHRKYMFGVGLVVLALVDWYAVNSVSFSSRALGDIVQEGKSAASYLMDQPGRFRVYSPSYSLPQHTAAWNRLELVDGVNPMQLKSYAMFVEKASGVPYERYSVAIPSFETGSPKYDNVSYRPDAAMLGLLNAGYIASEFDLQVEGLKLVAQFGSTRIYENMRLLPRSWLQSSDANLGENIIPVSIDRWEPNFIELNTFVPDDSANYRLVLSELAYPGWVARVNGEIREIQAVEGMFRSIQLPPGEHQVIFMFRPKSLFIGLGLWILGILWIFWRFTRYE